MAIAEQFAGLNMDQLIGAPLRAAADASTQLAHSTAEFINKVGFDNTGKVRTVAFGYQSRSVNEDGTSNIDEMKVAVPLLSIVPIPNLQVDEINVLFDMEVKQSERTESSMDLGASLSGSARIGFIKVNVTGSVSAHQSNTRSSDNSAKYHVDVRATNHGTPEGLARVLDMMAANVAPMLVGSTIKDGDGQNLSEQARIRAESLKSIRSDIDKTEKCLNVANNSLSDSIMQLKRVAATQQNIYREQLCKLQNATEDEQQLLTYSQRMDEINQSFSKFQNQAGDLIKMIADSGETPNGLSELFVLKALDAEGNIKAYADQEACYGALVAAQKHAVDSQKKVSGLEEELYEKKVQYSDMMSERSSLPEKETES